MVFLVSFGRSEAVFVRQLTNIRIRGVDYKQVRILDYLKNDPLLITLLNSFNSIVQNVCKYRNKITVADLKACQIISNKRNDDAFFLCLKILDVQYRIDKSIAGIDNINALNLSSKLLGSLRRPCLRGRA